MPVPRIRRFDPLAAIPAALFLLSLSLPAGAAGAEAPSHYGEKAVSAIKGRIRLKDCAGAIDDLKTGLKKGFPEANMLAGSMYENGVCVKRDWERAIPFYIQAWEGGLREGADRLAAGYAAPENGADVAAALWWAVRGRGRDWLPECAVGRAAAADIDRFAAELQAWPQARLAMCNYVTGVMSTLAAEARYPAQAFVEGVGGHVGIRFLPAVPRIEMQRGGVQEYLLLGLVNGDAARERGSRSADGFEKELGEVADRALRRYPQPAGIPAAMVVKTSYDFQIQFE